MRFNIIFTLLFAFAVSTMAQTQGIKANDIDIRTVSGKLAVSMQIVVDKDAKLRSNQQIVVTPVVKSADDKIIKSLPAVLINGRNMHYIYQRQSASKLMSNESIYSSVIRHKRGTESVVDYRQSVDLASWMRVDGAKLQLNIDTCGCGYLKSKVVKNYVLDLNPAKHMLCLPFPTPVPEVEKLVVHEGRARVIFEVDKWKLHETEHTYVNKRSKLRHTFNNAEQLQLIDDSLHYALKSPNAELAKLEICGFASPESPYLHNNELALNRAKAVMEYVERHDNLPDSLCSYSAVPENWQGFREMIVAATDITEQQRADLLELVDREVHSPVDYDLKEQELDNSPKFKDLYNNKIHPDWFPELRYTQFRIYTRLKKMTLEELRQVLKTEPERMSLNQIYTVAVSYDHGSKEFHEAMAAALKWFPNDKTANANAAALAVEDQRYDEALKYLEKAGDTDDVNVLRGIIATHKGKLDEARMYFNKAKNCPEAQRNLQLITE